MNLKLEEIRGGTGRAECQPIPALTGETLTDCHHHHQQQPHLRGNEEAKGRFLRDGYHIDASDGGDCAMTFNLGNGRQWKKRVWPRKDYPKKLLRWNSVEEILSYLISFDRHEDWISTDVQVRPPSGSIIFFDRSKTKKYRNDDYDWKTRRTMINTVREDRMKLKVGGYQLIYGCYAHSASDPNFHRRTYWLIQNPNLIMVHYLDSHEFFSSYNSISAAAREQVLLMSEPYLAPSNWSLMSISDLNLCALLDMAKTADTTKALLSQLTHVLSSNFQRSSSLEEVLVTNNAGFPVDMYEDSRSKKTKLVNAQPKKESETGNKFFVSAEMANRLCKSDEVWNVLSESPPTTTATSCPPKLGCTVTTPVADRISLLRIPHADGDCSQEDSTLNVVVEESSVDMDTSGPLETRLFLKGKKRNESSKKGKNKASLDRTDLLENLQKALNGLIQPIDYEISLPPPETIQPGTAQPDTEQSDTTQSGAAQPGTAQPGTTHRGTAQPDTARPGTTQPGIAQLTQLEPNKHVQETIPIATHSPRRISSSSSSSNNPENTSQSADLLSNMMYPREHFSEDDPSVSRESRTSSFRSTESNLTDSLDHNSLTNFSDSSIMPHPPTQRSDGHLCKQEEETGLELPEVPISWLFPGQSNSGFHSSSSSEAVSISSDSRIIDNSSRLRDPLMVTTTMTSEDTFNLDFDPESWQHLLECSPRAMTTEGQQTTIPSDYYQLDESLTAPLNLSHTTSTSSILTPNVSTTGVGDFSHLVPHVTVTMDRSNSWDDSWDGLWQDCDPDSINNWLQSSFPQGESNTLSGDASSITLTSSPTHVGHNRVTPLDDTHLPQELHDFISDSTTTPPPYEIDNGIHNLSSSPHTRAYSGPALLSSEELEDTTTTSDGIARKISDVSIYSEPLLGGGNDADYASSPRCCTLSHYQHHLSLPNLTNAADPSSFPSINIATGSENSFVDSGISSLACHSGMLSNTSLSPSPLQDIPEGIQMELESSLEEFPSLVSYKSYSSLPSSPSTASIASSTVSIQDLFDEPPSIRALCEMLSESVNVRQNDFSNMTLTDSEQDQLFRAAETIQGAFRMYKNRRQLRTKEKSAALLIEQYYKEYRDAKDQKERAARRIQNQYRMYKLRTRELNRAATFIQQMYRFQRIRKPSTHPYHRPSDLPPR